MNRNICYAVQSCANAISILTNTRYSSGFCPTNSDSCWHLWIDAAIGSGRWATPKGHIVCRSSSDYVLHSRFPRQCKSTMLHWFSVRNNRLSSAKSTASPRSAVSNSHLQFWYFPNCFCPRKCCPFGRRFAADVASRRSFGSVHFRESLLLRCAP